LAEVVSPDLIADIRLVRALSKELLEELDVDDVDVVEAVASSERRELVFCKLEICMKCDPSCAKFPGGAAAGKQKFPKLFMWTAFRCAMWPIEGGKERA
jgi:hypothetical protein